MRNILFACLLLSIFSCSRGYYNTVQSYYNYEEAYNLVHGLKEGVLIVQIPCYKKKLSFLKSLYESQKDAIKKQNHKIKYEKFVTEVSLIQSWLITSTEKQYRYSKYAFVPDTLINKFRKGERENIFLNNDLSLGAQVDVDTNKTIMILREFRDFSHLHIHKLDGSFPPEPFPYASTLPTGDIESVSIDDLITLKVDSDLRNAIMIVNNRLVQFYNVRKPPN